MHCHCQVLQINIRRFPSKIVYEDNPGPTLYLFQGQGDYSGQVLACSCQLNAASSGNVLNALQNYTGLASTFEDVLQSECNLVCMLQDHSSIKAEQGKHGQLGDSL